MPKHLAERILTSKAALEGERKQVTVLFADVKGSMELLADRDPEEARKLLDPVLERMMEAVHRYEGTINQVMGDGIMALFGAPVAHEDHAVRACYAAIDMQASLRRYAEEVRRSHGIEVQIRVGLNSGEVVVRAIGSDLHMDYTAVGQTTHLAGRMEQLAPPGSIRLTADTLRLAEGYVEVKPLGPVPVKGLDAPVEVYEMVGAGSLRSRMHAAAARGLTRFVGRDMELEQLRQALGRAAAGHGQVVAIVGEPGVGKSRLVWEVTHSHRTHGWLIVQAGSVSYGKATAYLPVIDLLKDYFQVDERDEHRKIREKVTGKLLTLDETLKPTMPALLALLDVPVEEPEWQALHPSHRRQRTLDGIKRLLLRESQAQPVLVVFEDLHWIDSETQALLDSLVESVPTARLLLLVNYRPEYEHRWGGKTFYTQLRLDPLPAGSAEALLDALLGRDRSLELLKRALIQRTEGNPFFLEEGVRALIETGVLAGERGAYRLTRLLQDLPVPATVQAVLAARIDRLEADDKRLLQEAAVVGTSVPLPILEGASNLLPDRLRAGLARLQAREFLYETALFPEVEYTFKHALTHVVAYQSLMHDQRRALHARIVKVIEGRAADRVVEQVEHLAHHALCGEVWDKAPAYQRQAGEKALGRGALRETVTHLEQAVAALGHLPRAPDTLDEAIDLRLSLRNALYALGEHERALAHLEAAEPLAVERGDPARLVRVLRYVSTEFMFLGDYARADEIGQRAAQAAESSGDVDLQLETRIGLAVLHIARGEYHRASDTLRRIASKLADEGPTPRFFGLVRMSAAAPGFLGWALAERGEFGEAIAVTREAIRRAEAVDLRYSHVFAAWSAGYTSVRRGDLAEAARVLEPALDRLRAAPVPIFFSPVASMLGLTYALAGRHAKALPLLAEAVEERARSWTHSLPFACLGEGHLLAGRTAEAGQEATRVLEPARVRGERGVEAWTLRLLGEVTAHSDPPDTREAERWYREASALAEPRGMGPLVAHCHLGLGKLYRRTGDRAKAEVHLARAKAMYREMAMSFWLEKAEADSMDVGP